VRVLDADPALWLPRSDDERAVGRRLYFYLRGMTVPDRLWNGTPADVAEQLYKLIELCSDLHDAHEDHLGHGTVLVLTRTVMHEARRVADRWCRDTTDIRPSVRTDCDERTLAALHADIADFADLTDQVSTTLAIGGGWWDGRRRPHRT
jgi:hypothetical protein